MKELAMHRFTDKVALITGASTGIGRATALAFAREGAAVAIGDIDLRAAQTVRDIEAAGGRAFFRVCDVSKPAEVAALVAACTDAYGRLDCAFNNAGVLPPPVPMHEVTEENLDRILEVDLKGVFFCMQAEIRQFLVQGGGAIVNTASVAGVVADPNMSAYVAAKHAVVGLTKAAGIEYARRNIRVNAIGPGFVATPMTQAWWMMKISRRHSSPAVRSDGPPIPTKSRARYYSSARTRRPSPTARCSSSMEDRRPTDATDRTSTR
jgi:NAD(P)-dependent dehydrogenase (short-subunit alcohol dehydrogenase family)